MHHAHMHVEKFTTDSVILMVSVHVRYLTAVPTGLDVHIQPDCLPDILSDGTLFSMICPIREVCEAIED